MKPTAISSSILQPVNIVKPLVMAITAIALIGCVSPNSLQRHVAETRFGNEQSTTQTATPAVVGGGGEVIYRKNVALPENQNTVFITLSTTGDTHGGAASWFNASVNGSSCNSGNEGAGFAPPGWVPLLKHGGMGGSAGDGFGGPGDLHDNGIYYTWCCREGVRPGGSNLIQIKMASSSQGDHVFVERSHYYVDSVEAKLCGQAEPLLDVSSALEKLPDGHRH